MAGGGSQTNASGGATQAQYSGGFQNLQDYLGANQNDTTGQKFTQNLNSSVDNANQAQADSQKAFQGRVDSGTTKEDKNLVDSAMSDPYGYLHPAGSTLSQGGYQAQPVGSQTPDLNSDKQSLFQAQLNAKYAGPQSYSSDQNDYQKAAGATQRAADEAKAAQSEGGRFALLGNYFGGQGGGNYSQGQKSLDNLLIQNNPQTQSALQQANQNAQMAQSKFGTLEQNLNNYATQGAAQTQGAHDYAANALGLDATGQFGSNSVPVSTTAGLKAQADQINKTNQNAYEQKRQELGALTGGYGVNALNYLSQNPAQASVNNLASQDQYNKINALTQLAGLSNTYLTDPSQLGTFNTNAPAYTFDDARYSSALANAKAAFELAHPNLAPTEQPGMPGYNPNRGNGSRF